MSRVGAMLPLRLERSIADFMNPDTFWLNPPEFLDAFRNLTGDTSMTEAAFTKPTGQYPGYINVQLDADGDFVITVRGDPDPAARTPAPGATAQMTIEKDDWYQLIAQAQRLRPTTDTSVAAAAAQTVTTDAGDPQVVGRDEPLELTAAMVEPAFHPSDAIVVDSDDREA